jgi:glutamate--cysteine ligase
LNYLDHIASIARLREKSQASTLRESRIGLEKESLRVNREGHIAQTPHPRALGSALTHPYITTDFSEALLEFVTPPFSDARETLQFLDHVHKFSYRHLDPEVLWCASMPCMVRGDDSVPIADYGRSNVGLMKQVYRRGLSHRYGRVMQTISGIHFNYSLPETFWRKLHPRLGPRALQATISDRYFGCVRNFQRYGWLVPLLFGSSPAICKSFLPEHGTDFEVFDSGTLFMPHATSLRMSDVGYKSSVQSALKIDHTTLESYVDSLTLAIETPHPAYEAMGVNVDGQYRQLNSNRLQIENEFYSFIRPKQITRSGEKPTLALRRRGVRYVEIRALDVNPFEPLGVSEQCLLIVEALVLFCSLHPSPPIDADELIRLDTNQAKVTTRGRDPKLTIDVGSGALPILVQATALLTALEPVCDLLDEAHGGERYRCALKNQQSAIDDPSLLPSAQVLSRMQNDGTSYFRFVMNMSLAHRDHFHAQQLSDAQSDMFAQEAAQSLIQQREIESSDSITFDEYLRHYFAQSDLNRENALG